jgi:hypothetical protein
MFLWCQINEYTRLFGTQEYFICFVLILLIHLSTVQFANISSLVNFLVTYSGVSGGWAIAHLDLGRIEGAAGPRTALCTTCPPRSRKLLKPLILQILGAIFKHQPVKKLKKIQND